MKLDALKESIIKHREAGRVLEGLSEILAFYELEQEGFVGFQFREELNPTGLLLTAEGGKATGIAIHIPKNMLNFEWDLVVNMLMHEMMHVEQRMRKNPITNKEEREWQAYYEMIVHNCYPKVPPLKDFYVKQFAHKAMAYYLRMGEGSDLQQKYKSEYNHLTRILETLNTMEEKEQNEISWKDFEKIEIRIGTILTVEDFPEVRKPAYQLTIDFGGLGIKKSSAQITALYTKEELIGQQIMAVVNFPKKQIATFMSECLVMGVYGKNEDVILLHPGKKVENGSKVG